MPIELPPVARNSAPDPEERGIECPTCGCRHFEVTKTRQGLKGRIIRWRRCRHCGRPIVTHEKRVK